jgi:hypothetical protein
MTPLMLEQIGWRTEIIFGGIAIGIGIFVFLFLPETGGLSLEHMTEVTLITFFFFCVLNRTVVFLT